MRDLALAEELVSRGHDVVYACSTVGLAWVEDAIRSRGCALIGPPEGSLADLAVDESVDLVVVDSYTLPLEEYSRVMERGVRLATISDHGRDRALGDVIIDPSPAGPDDIGDADGRVLAGLPYALIRREFRDGGDVRTAEAVPPRVLVAFGGTDALGVAATMARRVLELPVPVALTVIARDDLVAEIAGTPLRGDQSVAITRPGAGFAAVVRAHDAVISAAGSTSLELLAMGTAVGLVQVADNQSRYYDALPAAGAAIAVGVLDDVLAGSDTVSAALGALLGDPQRRQALRSAARAAVDGRGPQRVADALLSLL